MIRALTVATITTFSVFAVHPGMATNYGWSETDDPFSKGKCQSTEIVSYGSYIYQWPSKYDGVYWPFTDTPYIWQCPESGYVAYPEDFETLSDSEHKAIAAYLSVEFQGPKDKLSEQDIRSLMEGIYQRRKKGDEFWVWFNRVLAYWWEGDDPDRALDYRRKTLPLIEAHLKDLKPSIDMIQNLYLVGDYNRQLGNYDAARESFDRAKAVRWTNENGEDQVGMDYFNEIIDERAALMTAH